jgi:hypothetical protein
MFVESLAPFFADFAAPACTVGGVSVKAIFDADPTVGRVGMMGMAGTQPALMLATASVAADPVGLAAVVNGVSYVVAAHEPDGTGMSLLLLERA